MEQCKVNITAAGVLRCHSNVVPMECYLVLNNTAQTLIATLCCTAGTLCVLENALVLYLIFSSPKIRRKPSYLFLGSLALADTLASFIFVWSFLQFHVFSGADSSKVVFLLKLGGVNTTFTASLGSLLLMAFDRYICILKPSTYKVLVTSKRALVALVVLWLSIALIASLPLFGWNCCRLNSPCSELFPFVDNSYLLSWASFVAVLLASIIYAYGHVLWKARQHVAYMEKHHRPNGQTNTKMRLDIKLAKTLAIVLLVLITCWTPGMALVTYSIFFKMDTYLKKVFAFCSTLCLVNSMVNPAIYALRSRELSSALRKICTSFKRKADISESNPEAESTQRTLPLENISDRFVGNSTKIQASEGDNMEAL
ncbi:cannabinoid receptor 2 [Anolis carolinensis]|uniref:Cannabinoid receptor 2 n=1 Tax=Anolis carolinensis TaxID=28377 RepID=H9GA23_ANOCA|nr:PREDICTED: cannabinoid receptor 2 [Anolis carolinensis]XP_008119003.1 PREDICTED: cannabinoid receptor 2 [Anolis carolinensis]|eukprot:XP_003227614.1 PREDICTED: cannabinoid receptor 2 [Anolis carolinensis]